MIELLFENCSLTGEQVRIKLYFYLPKIVLVPSSNQKIGLADVFPLCHICMSYVYVVEQFLVFAITVLYAKQVLFNFFKKIIAST